MEPSEQLGLGWLVFDERGVVTQWEGAFLKELAAGKGVFGVGRFAKWDKSEGGAFGESYAALSKGTKDEATGVLTLRLKRQPVVEVEWTMRPLVEGKKCRLVHVYFRQAPKASDLDGKKADDPAFVRAPLGMYRADAEGKVFAVNEALAEMCRLRSPEELMGKLGKKAGVTFVDRHHRREILKLLRAEGQVHDFQSEIRLGDSETIWVSESARMVADPKSRSSYYEVTVFDVTPHREAEAALLASREQFRRLVETANVVPWESDVSGRFQYVGPQAEQLLGFPVEEWLKPGFWMERIHPDDHDWVTIVRDEAVDRLGQFESEYRVLNAKGEEVWVRDIVRVIESETNPPTLGGFLHDITHRRAAEESLRESQDFIDQISRASPLIWYVFDADQGRIVYLNGGGIRALGASKESLLKAQPSFFIALSHPDELIEHQAHFGSLPSIQRGEFIEREFRLRAASGKWVWLRTHEAALKVDENGLTRRIVGVAEDITFQQAALVQLANNEALYRRLAETTRVIPFEMELAPIHFTYIGPQATELLGYPVAKWTTPGFWSSVVHAEDRPRVERILAEAVARQDTHVEVELRLKDNAGGLHWIRQIVRCEATQGSFSRGRGFFMDISAAKLIETEREESRRQLRELALQNQRAREEERVAVSREIHDELGQALTLLRIDLAWINGRISKSIAGTAGSSLLTKVQEMDRQLTSTLETVRRIATQLRPPVLDEFGLSEAIEWQASEFSRRVGVRCDVKVDNIDCESKDTATAVFRIFQELLTNIARHSRASKVRVRLVEAQDAIQLCVADNGCGFDPEHAKKKAGFGVLGMRERARALGGTLQIRSTAGQGTTAELSIPNNVIAEGD